jgi:hypothetical protein
VSDHVCRPVYDGDGNVIAHALMAPDASEETRLALLALVAAVRREFGDDPEAADRQAEAVRRIRERVARLREES